MKRKLFALVFVLALLVFAFASCGGGHTHDYKATVTPPSCKNETDGFTTYTCECGDSYTGDTVPWVHTLVPKETVEANCQTGGYTKKVCADCGKEVTTDVTDPDPTKHVYSTEWRSDNEYHWHEATCGHADAGVSEKAAHTIEGGTCTVCGAGVCNHPNKQVVLNQPPTCVDDGIEIFTCPDCDAAGREYNGQVVLPALGHEYDEQTVAPTCTEMGYTLKTCHREGCTEDTEGHSVKEKYVSLLGHDFDENGVCQREGCGVTATVKVTYIYLDAEGAEIENENPKFFAGQGNYTLKNPSRKNTAEYNYKFLGWYTDEACTTLCTYFSIETEAEITLYAKWEAHSTSEVHEHTYETEWSFDDYEHWHESSCEHWGLKSEIGEHTYDSESYCTVCGRRDPTWEKKYTITWDPTTIIIQMNEDSNSQELPASCKRYLAGETSDNQQIDKYVRSRNAAATAATSVTADYRYLEDGKGYGWGANVDNIYAEVGGTNPDKPDVYINFVYDMLSASLKGSFSNLYTTRKGSNEFQFTDRSFKDTGTGYMVEYMQSMTLSDSQMYLLSSDYFIDMVRAFLVVPVNITMLESVTVNDDPYSDEYNSDRTGDGKFTIDDFYELIKDKRWNYETLADFSNAIYTPGTAVSGGDPMGTLNDKLGFALGIQSGLPASGMLYTTTIEIIHREWSDEEGNWVFDYPDTNQELLDFCNNLTELFTNTRGVIAIGNDQALGYGNDGLTAIRNRFASDRILFGGVICLGSLEYDEYGNMQAGFGVAPVPLYRAVNETGRADDYQTQIHNLGRVGAISRTTNKFTQCSAYLDYQSTHSTAILNDYYKNELSYGIAGGGKNVEILNYIRRNVRSSFDKAFEDAISVQFGNSQGETNSKGQQWHYLIKEAGFKLSADSMKSEYTRLVVVKQQQLQALKASYATLPM